MGNSIFAATSSEIMRTTDHGTSWDSCGQLTSITALGEDGTNLFAATNNGVFRSTDDGSSWDDANNGIVGNSCINIAVCDSNIIAWVGDGFYGSTDNGSSWAPEFRVGVPTIDTFAFIYNNGTLHRRDLNDGSGWQDITDALPMYEFNPPNGLPYPVTVALTGLAVVGKVLFAEAQSEPYPYDIENGIIRSTNYGSTWTSVNLNTSLGSFAILDTIIYASVSGTIYRSSDYGANWTLVSNTVPFASTLIAIEAVPGSIFASTQHGIFRSTDSGITWNAENNGLKDSDNILLSHNGKIFAQSSNNIFYWLENSSEWISVDEGLPASFTWGQIAANDNYLFVGTSGLGVWERPLSDFGSNLNSSSIINSLYVYPNPITTTTNISFTALQQGNATVKIFDQIGRVESSVFEGELEPGEYSFDWIKPTGLSNGAYMCEVSMNGQTMHSLLIILQ
jgi:photosystem II stability/assembly factor-like uncharacterized protein